MSIIKRLFVFAFTTVAFFVKSDAIAKTPIYRTVTAVKMNSSQSMIFIINQKLNIYLIEN